MAKENDDHLQLMRKRGKLNRPGKIGVPGGGSCQVISSRSGETPAPRGPPVGMVKGKRTGQVQ